MSTEIRDIRFEEKQLEVLNQNGLDFIQITNNAFRNGFKYICYGEIHDFRYGHSFVASSIPELKRIGIENICLEIDKKLQVYVDKYLLEGDEDALSVIEEYEDELGDEVVLVDSSFSSLRYHIQGRVQGEYFQIIKQSREHQLKVFFIDDIHSTTYNGDCDRNMCIEIEKLDNAFVYAGAGHLSGVNSLCGVASFSNQKKNFYTIRPYYESDATDSSTNPLSVSSRMYEALKRSRYYGKVDNVGFDIGDPNVANVIKDFYLNRNPSYFGEAVVFHFDCFKDA